MKKNDFEILIQYSDKYIAYVDRMFNILASGSTISEVEEQLTKKDITDATITYIPPVDKSFSP